MDSPPSALDEVALHVLLAEGVDLSTAWEASRREGCEEDSHVGLWVGVVVLLILAAAMLVVSFI